MLSPQIIGSLVRLRLRSLLVRLVLVNGCLEAIYVGELLFDRSSSGRCFRTHTVYGCLLLLQLGVIIARINIDQQISLIHRLIVSDVDRLDFSGDLWRDFDGVRSDKGVIGGLVAGSLRIEIKTSPRSHKNTRNPLRMSRDGSLVGAISCVPKHCAMDRVPNEISGSGEI